MMPIHSKLTTPPAVSPGVEPLQPVDEDLVSRMVLHDAERVANPHLVINRVVFDATDASPRPAGLDQGGDGDVSASGSALSLDSERQLSSAKPINDGGGGGCSKEADSGSEGESEY
jgi:hypothetical protein